jgi:HEAT repeat protein
MYRRFPWFMAVLPLLLAGCGESGTSGQQTSTSPPTPDLTVAPAQLDDPDIAAHGRIQALLAAERDPEARARSLAAIKSERAVVPLIELLGDSDAEASAIAEESLRQRMTAARPQLQAAVGASAQHGADVRLRAALLLCESVPALSLEQCLGRLVGTNLDSLRDPSPVAQQKDAQAWLVARSTEGDTRARADALLLLSAFGPDAIDPLLAALGNPDLTLRTAAAAALSHIRDPRLVEPLLAQLAWVDEQEWIQIESEQYAAKFGDEEEFEGEPELPEEEELFEEESETPAYDPVHLDALAVEATKALGAQGAVAIRPLLEAEAGSTVAPHRADAVLREMAREELVPSLVAMLAEPADLGTIRVARLLADTGDPAAIAPLLATLADADDDEQPWLRPEFLRFGEPAVEPCLARLDDESAHVRTACIQLLAQVAPTRHGAALLAALADPDPKVVAAAAAGARHLDAESVRELLLPLLRHRDAETRTAAAQSLGGLRDTTAVPALIAAIGQLDFPVSDAEGPAPEEDAEYVPLEVLEPDGDERLTTRPANAGMEALAMIGAPAVPAILDALEQKPGAPAAARLLYALADIPAAREHPRTAMILTAAVDAKEPARQAAAAHALAMLQPQGWLPALLRGLERERTKQFGIAADYAVALGDTHDSGAAEALIASLAEEDDEGIREIVIASLGRNDSPPARAWLDNALAARDLAAVAAAYDYFIRTAQPGFEGTVIAALEDWGTSRMAARMLNSGNDTLHDAAREWAENRNYVIISLPVQR